MQIAQKSVPVYILSVYDLHLLLAFPLKTLKLPLIVLKTSAPKELKRPKYKMFNGVLVPT